jgi:hypothetical protein
MGPMTAHMPHGAYRGPYGPTWPVNPMKAYMDNVAHGAYENPYGHAWHVGSMRTSKGPAYYMRPLMAHMDPREPWGIWGEGGGGGGAKERGRDPIALSDTK